MNILEIQPGDVIRNTNTGQERVVVSVMPNAGMIEFDDSHLCGWSDASGWLPTGNKAPVPERLTYTRLR